MEMVAATDPGELRPLLLRELGQVFAADRFHTATSFAAPAQGSTKFFDWLRKRFGFS